MIINTDDYNEIDDYQFLEYYLEDSLYIRIGINKPKYYAKKNSVPKLQRIFEAELEVLGNLISGNKSRAQILEKANEIKNLKSIFPNLPCESLDYFIKEFKI